MARIETPDQFAAELLASVAKAPVEAAKVVKKAAQNIKDEGRANFLAGAPVHNAGAARTINYDEPALFGTRVESEVGFDRDVDRSANIAWLTEYGGGGDHSPAHRDIGRAADNEEDRFVGSLQSMASKLL
jgi:hypothetical protein